MMFRKWFAALALVYLIFSIPDVFGAEDSEWNYWLLFLPPGGSVSVNDEKIINKADDRGRVTALSDAGFSLSVPSSLSGVKIRNRHFEASLNRESSIHLQNGLMLDAGSLYVRTRPENEDETTLMLQNLTIRFKKAEFLAYVSGDKKQRIVKVMIGDITVENSSLQQKANIFAGMASEASEAGRLLIPYPIEDESREKRWFLNKAYSYPYRPLSIAHAGDDQRVLGNIPVALDGSASDFSTGDIFEWTLTSGPSNEEGKPITEVPFDSTNIVKPLFTPRVDGEYHFSLQIMSGSGEKSNIDEVTVFVGKRYLKPIWIYPDVPPTHPNNLAITYLYKKNVMKGSEDKKTGKILFRPAETLNRVEILKVVLENRRQKIMTTEEIKAQRNIFFHDVKPEHWFAPYVVTAQKLGLIEGSGGLYRPGDQVILSEAIKIVVKSFQASLDGISKGTEIPFPDIEANSWTIPYFAFVKKYNLVDPDISGKIHPEKLITRAQFAEIIYRMESINLGEKRGFLLGKLKKSKTNQGIPQAEIYIYKALEQNGKNPLRSSSFIEKGDLYHKTLTKYDGTFTVSLPIGTKYYIEGLLGDTISSNSIVTELSEDRMIRIELEMILRE